MRCSVEGGMLGEECIGARRSLMVMSRECW